MKNVQKNKKIDLDKAFPPPLKVVLPFVSFLNQERRAEWIPMFNCREYLA